VTLYAILVCAAVLVLAAQGTDLPAAADLAYRRRALEILMDLGVLTLSYYLAFRIRFPAADASVFFPPFVESIPLVVGCQVAALYVAGKYRLPWRIPMVHQVGVLARGLLIGMVLSMMLVLTLYRFEGFSRGVFAIDLVIAWSLLLGVRAATSGIEHYLRRPHAAPRCALIYGAGGGGTLVARELHQNRTLAIDPVGFLDDDPAKQRARVEGIPVLGTSGELERLAARLHVTDVIISARELDAGRLQDLQERCQALGLTVRRLRFQLDEVRASPTLLRHER
jgi:UDP-GlcNAc:undecaprenyl-phosphate/decaprenyl-phosphate GlcNAc-1-phosphate transferase